MAQQTAVDFLVKELRIEMGYGRELTKSDQRVLDEIIEEAKAMEKEQIIHSFNEGMSNSVDYFANGTDESEQYYNETYNK